VNYPACTIGKKANGPSQNENYSYDVQQVFHVCGFSVYHTIYNAGPRLKPFKFIGSGDWHHTKIIEKYNTVVHQGA
jgi:hypothetical protein